MEYGSGGRGVNEGARTRETAQLVREASKAMTRAYRSLGETPPKTFTVLETVGGELRLSEEWHRLERRIQLRELAERGK